MQVATFERITDLDEKLRHRTVTTGCGQGTVFGRSAIRSKRSAYRGCRSSSRRSTTFWHRSASTTRSTGARGGARLRVCAVVRHRWTHASTCSSKMSGGNAADAISGYMWLNAIDGKDKWFYTTGRL